METSISEKKIVTKWYIHVRCKGCQSDSSAVINKDGYEAAAWTVGVGPKGNYADIRYLIRPMSA